MKPILFVKKFFHMLFSRGWPWRVPSFSTGWHGVHGIEGNVVALRFIVHDFQLLPVSLTQGDLCCISKNWIGSPLFSYYGDRRLSIMVLPIVFTIECGEVDKIWRRSLISFNVCLFFDSHLTTHQWPAKIQVLDYESNQITFIYFMLFNLSMDEEDPIKRGLSHAKDRFMQIGPQ